MQNIEYKYTLQCTHEVLHGGRSLTMLTRRRSYYVYVVTVWKIYLIFQLPILPAVRSQDHLFYSQTKLEMSILNSMQIVPYDNNRILSPMGKS